MAQHQFVRYFFTWHKSKTLLLRAGADVQSITARWLVDVWRRLSPHQSAIALHEPYPAVRLAGRSAITAAKQSWERGHCQRRETKCFILQKFFLRNEGNVLGPILLYFRFWCMFEDHTSHLRWRLLQCAMSIAVRACVSLHHSRSSQFSAASWWVVARWSVRLLTCPTMINDLLYWLQRYSSSGVMTERAQWLIMTK